MARRLLWLSLLAMAVLVARSWATRPLEYAPGVLVSETPLQQMVPESVFRFEDYVLTRRASFSLRARVLSSESYWLGREADVSPLDLALGWGAMSDQAVLDRIEIRQSARWYRTRYEFPAPLPDAQITLNSSNMHIIPARGGLARRLDGLREGDIVRMSGYLVDVDHPSGWHWRTSLSREDTGAGACEIFYVEQVDLETPR